VIDLSVQFSRDCHRAVDGSPNRLDAAVWGLTRLSMVIAQIPIAESGGVLASSIGSAMPPSGALSPRGVLTWHAIACRSRSCCRDRIAAELINAVIETGRLGAAHCVTALRER
jgi:hypothetical protein